MGKKLVSRSVEYEYSEKYLNNVFLLKVLENPTHILNMEKYFSYKIRILFESINQNKLIVQELVPRSEEIILVLISLNLKFYIVILSLS